MEGAPTKVLCRASLIGHLRLDVHFLQGFAFLCKLGLLFFKPRWNYQISRWNHPLLVLALRSEADPGFFVGGGALLRNGVIDKF